MARGEVLDVNGTSRKAANLDVALNLDFLARGRPTQKTQLGGNGALVHLALVYQRLVLAVAHDGFAELSGVVHHAAHHAGALHPPAIVGEGHGAMCHHVAHLRQDFALQALGAGSRNVYAAFARIAGAGAHVLNHRPVVDGGVGVGHAADSGHAAMGCGAGAGFDVFLVLLARFAQMHVDVYQARNHHLAGHVAHFGIGCLEPLPHFGDLAIRHQDVHGVV